MGFFSKLGDMWNREGMTKEQWATRQRSLRVMDLSRGHAAVRHTDGTVDYYTDFPDQGGIYKGSMDRNGNLVERSGPIHPQRRRITYFRFRGF